MRPLEGVIALIFTLGGIRSLVHWLRRPFEGTDVTDHLLYALFVMARVGTWFAFAALFWIYATIEVQGRAAIDELRDLAWFLIVPIGLAALQVGVGWFLGRRGDASPPP